MKISILCSDPKHPVVPSLTEWSERYNSLGHKVSLLHDASTLADGNILFLISCSEIIHLETRQRFDSVLVIHASDLPKGRGWSPYIWSILEGETEITVSMLEASDPVDTGKIWFKEKFNLKGHELLDEINEKLFQAELILMDRAINEWDSVVPSVQSGEEVSYYPKRTPKDSKLNVDKTLAEQFELLRVVDSERFPAFFEYRGHKYILKIEKANEE